jgi:hypothetical protein
VKIEVIAGLRECHVQSPMALMREGAERATSRAESAPSEGAQPDRMLRFATRVDTVDALIETFSNLIEKDSLFIVTKSMLPVGLRRRFAVTLRDGRPVLSGEAEVQESPALLSGPGSAAGVRLRLLRLTPASLALHKRMLDHKREHETTQVTSMPAPPALGSTESDVAPAGVARRETSASAQSAVAPSGFILPANPLSELADSTLQAFVECAIFEDYGVPRLDIGDLDDPIPDESQEILQDRDHGDDEDAPASTSAKLVRTGTEPPARADDAARPVTRPPPLPRPATLPRAVTAPPPEVPPPPPPPVAAPPTIIEVPVQPITISIGIKTQLVTAVLALVIGLLSGYLIFGSRTPGGVTPPGMPQTAAAATQPAVASEVATPAVAPEAATLAALTPNHAGVAVAPAAFAEPGQAELTAPEKSAAASAPPNAATDTCTASIDSNVDDARVLINGALAGTGTVREQSVPCGEELLITVEHPRYQTFETRVTTSPGTPVQVAASLQRPAARLTLVSTPPGATLSVNGKVIGRSPATVDVKAHRSVRVTATLKGYKVWARRFRVSKSGLTITAALDRIGPGTSR